MEIVFPIEGDMLHARDGIVTGMGLKVEVVVSASAGHEIRIGGGKAAGIGQRFVAEFTLDKYENIITATNGTTGEEKQVRVYWLPKFAGGYRLSIDDNIWFLRDIHQHEDVYNSIFDNPYLAFLRGLHLDYDTKVHLNLFYETDGFNLSQLSDKFAAEWKAQASWLRLSFHALGEFPDKPYQSAGYAQVKRDGELVMNEIRRFAGPELMGPVTTLHWGEATVEGARALRHLGYKGLLGYFNVDDDLPAVSFYLDVERRRHIKKRFVWKDNREDLAFVRTSIVIDKTDLVNIRKHLDGHRANGGLPPFVDLLVHEQYFYPFYFNYQPDFTDRVRTAVVWAANNGYEPRFLEECIF
jgi:hypothetical protein